MVVQPRIGWRIMLVTIFQAVNSIKYADKDLVPRPGTELASLHRLDAYTLLGIVNLSGFAPPVS